LLSKKKKCEGICSGTTGRREQAEQCAGYKIEGKHEGKGGRRTPDLDLMLGQTITSSTADKILSLQSSLGFVGRDLLTPLENGVLQAIFPTMLPLPNRQSHTCQYLEMY